MDDQEILTLVDENDHTIGTIARSEVSTMPPHTYIRAVNAFIINKDGLVWTPIRNPHKKLAPNGLDYSVGAHIAAGEEYEEALVREFAEEAGMKIAVGQCREIAYNLPADTDSGYFNRLYVLRTDTLPSLSSEHVSGSSLPIDELIKKIEDGAITKDGYLADLQVLKEYLTKESPTDV